MGNGKIKLVQIIADSDVGGGASHVLGLLKNIDKKLFDCYLICPAGNLAREARDIPGVETTVALMRSKFDFIAVNNLKTILMQIQAKYEPFGPMIVHTHGPRAGLLGRLAIPKGAYSVYTEHIWTREYHLESYFNEWLQLGLMRRLNKRSNLIIAVSTAVKEFLMTRRLAPENRIEVIPNGISFARNKKQGTITKHKRIGNHHVIGTVGTLNHLKGQIYLVEAMPEIIKHFPHATLEIIGEGDERRRLESKIQELKLERHVTLLGKQYEPLNFMSKWSVFVLPSLAETFGISILEAFGAGLPVVSSSVGGIRDIIRDGKNGLFVSPESPSQIAEKVIELWQHPAVAEKMIRESKKTLEKFEWESVVKKIEKNYMGIIK